MEHVVSEPRPVLSTMEHVVSQFRRVLSTMERVVSEFRRVLSTLEHVVSEFRRVLSTVEHVVSKLRRVSFVTETSCFPVRTRWTAKTTNQQKIGNGAVSENQGSNPLQCRRVNAPIHHQTQSLVRSTEFP